uniref:Uncharacterized protein n=1 Tax=Anguilla anguilla TaxID=7936 RepID=A0A0E9PAJ6_ANGAN
MSLFTIYIHFYLYEPMEQLNDTNVCVPGLLQHRTLGQFVAF